MSTTCAMHIVQRLATVKRELDGATAQCADRQIGIGLLIKSESAVGQPMRRLREEARRGGYPTSGSDAIAEATDRLLVSQKKVRALGTQVQALRFMEEKQQKKIDTLQRAIDTHAEQIATLWHTQGDKAAPHAGS